MAGSSRLLGCKNGDARSVWGEATRLTLRGAKQIVALHAELSKTDGEADISAEERLAIFLAGARGEYIPAFLEEAFNRMLEDQDLPDD